MITKQVIDQIYKRFGKKTKNPELLDMGMLFEKAGLLHDIMIDPETNTMTIESIPEDSPFHTILIDNINAIVPFEEWVGIVLHSSILFLNIKKPQVSIHLRQTKESIWSKLGVKHVAL